MNKRKILLIISFVAIVSFVVFFYFNVLETYEQGPRVGAMINGMPMSRMMPVPFEYRLWLSPLFLLIAVIPISYYLISRKMEKNMKAMLKIVGKNGYSNGKSTPINKDAVLKLLNFNERKVLERLIKRKGEVLQSEISHMDGMDKLKTHRAIRNLETKGVIETESNGKTKRIMLTKDIRGILLK
jgi:DNA-binding MarR family transcriptional regulator